MKKLNYVSIALIAVLSSACSTMYFHKGQVQQSSQVEASNWHHGGILRLVEFSPPVQAAQVCDGKAWTAIKVERSFVNGLAGSFSWGLYDPWTTGYSCR